LSYFSAATAKVIADIQYRKLLAETASNISRGAQNNSTPKIPLGAAQLPPQLHVPTTVCTTFDNGCMFVLFCTVKYMVKNREKKQTH
jgi:hypothetical protein